MLKLKRVGAGVRNAFTPKYKKGAVSFFDVKELYDEAYKQKAQATALMVSSKLLMQQASQLDTAYRLQFAERSPHYPVGRAA